MSTTTAVMQIIALFLAAMFGIFLLASFTVIPMRANYKECGTIFLCSAQHPATARDKE